MPSKTLEITDNDLLINIQKGNKNSFDSLFLRYYPYLCAYAGQYVDRYEAEEIVQDTMVWIWENRKRILIQTSIKNYLFRAVKNKCLTRKNRMNLRQQIIESIRKQMNYVYESPDFYDIKELTQRLETALVNLPDSYRESFELNRFHNLTYQEIGQKLGVSPKTVDYRIQQALKILRVELKDYLPLLLFLNLPY